MNERIKELMEYAVRFRLDPDSNAYEAQITPEDLEKFAELIVVECKLAINQIDADDASMAVGLYRAEVAIENHFGVKE